MSEPPRTDLDFLPEALVEEMLRSQKEMIEQIECAMKEMSTTKNKLRDKLLEIGRLKNVSEFVKVKSYPTTCGVDGTYSIIKQLSIDSVALAAFAVEGLIPPRESRFWEKPHHLLKVFPVVHSPKTIDLCRHLMFSFELELATKAPHRVVFLDGSLTSQLIALGQGLATLDEGEIAPPKALSDLVEQRLEKSLEDYLTVLTSPRVDRMFVGVPKYTSRTEIISELLKGDLNMPILSQCDDKGLLSIILEPGDVVGPIELQKPQGPWHISGISSIRRSQFIKLKDDVARALDDLYVLYFKPTEMHPALRIEINGSVVGNERKLSILLEALFDQTAIPGVFEPYPLYIADMFVKHIHGGLSELREAALSDLGRTKGIDVSDFYLSLHDYRTESGFE
ncbi:MAG: DNA double-strand break repair nuclease NurA [Candidatus Bathyarchaeota archaeon]|nr:DNA double-strand break repair nuclease NurA [Candidatus Bathyarchaeota archaeon]